MNFEKMLSVLVCSLHNHKTLGGSAYGSSTGTWNGYSQYLNADGLPVVSPVRIKSFSYALFFFFYNFIFFFNF